MGFLNGRATYLRFRGDGLRPDLFGDDHLDKLREFEAGRQRIASADGVEAGWAAGDSVLDTDFSLGKNVVGDALCFDLRVDTDKLPAELMKAYYQADLKALAAGNPSGLPSARQKREARESARERLEGEAKDGRFRKRKCVPVLWDRATGEVLFGATSLSDVDRFTSLFRQTFGVELEAVTAGRCAARINETVPGTRHVIGMQDGPGPSHFVPGESGTVSWVADEQSCDWLGNEFLLWLWFTSDADSDTVRLADGTECTFMFARQLLVECPRGQTGADGFASENPTRLPEARRAAQAGKLPRRAGLTLVRHDQQYELTLHAESLAVGSAKLQKPEEQNPRARLDERVGQLRHLRETLDGLYAAFLAARLTSQWAGTLERMQRWLQREDRRGAA